MSSELSRKFHHERSRRELLHLDDIDAMRKVALEMLELLETQRETFNLMIKKGWVPDPEI